MILLLSSLVRLGRDSTLTDLAVLSHHSASRQPMLALGNGWLSNRLLYKLDHLGLGYQVLSLTSLLLTMCTLQMPAREICCNRVESYGHGIVCENIYYKNSIPRI